MKFGYARVSTKQQNLDRQIDWLLKQGCEEKNIFVEKITGTKKDRPQLMQLMLRMREGDILYIESFSRLGRSTKDLIVLVETFKNMGVALVSGKENFDTTTPQGMLMLTLFMALAQFERDVTAERVRGGLDAARARGRLGGRPKADPAVIDKALKMYDARTFSTSEIAETCGISRATLYKYINRRKANETSSK